jgi:transcriptional regulator with GAF, ATPase, and Fis domain
MRPPPLSGFRSVQAEMVGVSAAIQGVRDFARRVARGDAKVLITGESGVGKEIVARYIHEHSTRASRAFVPVNCAGLSETLLESELFGHVRGSFTGAYRDKVGRLQLAHRGTVLLDELGEMSLRMQAMLLRFLESGEIQPVGGDGVSATIDTRVIAATNRNLQDLVASGGFREDLLYRIKVVHLHIIPLRERREDIRPLVAHTIAGLGRTLRFTDEAMRALETYHWPGNVRELQNVIEQASWLGEFDELGMAELPQSVRECAVKAVVSEPSVTLIDELYNSLSTGKIAFWDSVYQQFIRRDLTRNDLRELVRRGLSSTNGNYRALLPLFGVPTADYKRFLNFLAAHDCTLDYRGFRGAPQPPRRSITH